MVFMNISVSFDQCFLFNHIQYLKDLHLFMSFLFLLIMEAHDLMDLPNIQKRLMLFNLLVNLV